MTALAWANSPAVRFAGSVSLRSAAADIAVERRRRAPLPVLDGSAVDGAAPVWVLPSRRAGDATQAMALAEGLGLPFTVKQLAWRPVDLLRAPPFAATLAGLEPEAAASLKAPWPMLVLSAGCENEPVARWIRQASGGRTRIVHVGRPWGPLDGYDLVVTTPQYRLPERPNVLQNEAPLHRVTADRLAEAVATRKAPLPHMPRPHFAGLAGGGRGPHPPRRPGGEPAR